MKKRQWNMNEFYVWEKSSRDILDVKRAYIDMAGDVCAGLMLSELVYWNLPSKNGTNKMRVFRDGEFWVAVKRYEWYDRIRLTPDQADRSIGILLEKKLVVKALYRFGGNPVVHLRINEEVFMDRWKETINAEYVNPYKPVEATQNNDEDVTTAKSNSPNGEIQLADWRIPLTETTTETTNVNYADNSKNELSAQSNISSEPSHTFSLGEKRKTCPAIPPPEERIDDPVIDKSTKVGAGVDELCPNSPGSDLLFEKLGREAKARGRRAPKRFSSIAQRDAFLEIEKKIGGDLEKAIDYVLRQGITSIKGIVNYLAKWGTQSNNGYKNKDQPVVNQRGVLKNPDGSFYA